MAFEESSSQILRNMKSVGIDLARWVDAGLLRIHAARPTLTGIESHLVGMQVLANDFKPHAVVADSATAMISQGSGDDVRAMLSRLVDFLKGNQATFFCTVLTHQDDSLDRSNVAISSLVDAWITLRILDVGGERPRALTIVKARGIAHSNQNRKYELTSEGFTLARVGQQT
jgi:circadian clock protein KaiC